MSPAPILAAIAARAAAAGFDLAAACAAADHDAEVTDGQRLPVVGDRPRTLAVVLGNTRALWPCFAAALRADVALQAAADPIDRYTERALDAAVTAAIADVAPGTRWALRFAHQPPYVAVQRVARLAGLAHVSTSHLCVHPTFGPWIALRAVVVVDVEAPPRRPPLAPPCTCADGCGPALAAALADGPLASEADLVVRWRAWAAVRDACPVGRAHRYDDDQLRYHYTKDRDILARLIV